MAEELMTAEDVKWLQGVVKMSFNGDRVLRILATYAECARLRAALTEREGECERLDAANAKLVRDNLKFAVSLVDAQQKERDIMAELAALRQRVAEGEADTAIVGWMEKNAKHELRITRDGDGWYDLRRWHQRYVSFQSWNGGTLRTAFRGALEAARGPRTGGGNE